MIDGRSKPQPKPPGFPRRVETAAKSARDSPGPSLARILTATSTPFPGRHGGVVMKNARDPSATRTSLDSVDDEIKDDLLQL